jgi:hypothetical protein
VQHGCGFCGAENELVFSEDPASLDVIVIVENRPSEILNGPMLRLVPPSLEGFLRIEADDVDFLAVISGEALDRDESRDRLHEFVHPPGIAGPPRDPRPDGDGS